MFASGLFESLFLQPKIITGMGRLLMLVPLLFSIAVVYKTIRCQKLSSIPLASLGLTLMILAGMMLVGVVLLVSFRLLA